jgi:hypothetical protein
LKAALGPAEFEDLIHERKSNTVLKKILAVPAASLAVVLGAGTVASADAPSVGSDGFGGSVTAIGGDQSGLVNINAPLLDLRCALPWFGSAVLGVSLPIGMQAVVCDDVDAPITQNSLGHNGLL